MEEIGKKLISSMWIERYRPRHVKNILLPEKIRTLFKAYVTDGEIPNIILYSSSPGTGKCLTGDSEIEIKIDKHIYNKFKELFNN